MAKHKKKADSEPTAEEPPQRIWGLKWMHKQKEMQEQKERLIEEAQIVARILEEEKMQENQTVEQQPEPEAAVAVEAEAETEVEVEEEQPQASTAEDSAEEREGTVIVRNYTIAALAPGLVPLPLFDLVVLTAVQLKMLHRLSKHYDVDFSSEIGKSAIAALVGGVIPVGASPAAASLLKFVPGVGQTAGIASMVILGGACTHAIGIIFMKHFKSGGTFLNFDVDNAKQHFADEFEKGKKVVTDLKDKYM